MKTPFAAIVICAFALLAGCATTGDPFGNAFPETPPKTPPGTSARTLECTHKSPDGTCNQKKCTQGPGGFTFDCASYGAACINAGHHWSGTKEGGTCSRVL